MEKNEILVVYGSRPGEMAVKLAEAADLAGLIGDTKKRVGLKPNLVVSRPAGGGATTHPEIAGGLIRYLQGRGFRNLVILEGSWVGDSTAEAFRVCGYRKLAEETGVPLIDTQTGKARAYDCGGMKIEICDSAMELDFMINLPVLKGHCQTLLTCALKNNKGIMPDREKRRFHSLGLTKPIAHLNTAARNDFILVDGICGDLDFEEGGNPVFAGRMFACRDPVLCDAYAAGQLGYTTADIPYIGLAEKLGVGSADLKKARITPLSDPAAVSGESPKPQGKVRQLAVHVREDRACSACYAGLIFALSRMERRELDRLRGPVAIGQGYRGKKGAGTGVGLCTAGFSLNCPGCPPSGADIAAFLRGL
ncbi:MAG: DUF362 domain-containing protein [Treponema sp.]|jgi:uncharacterized protein (DUF362 family)|nr:DUF362 domain-containing protein [Treponema sp.]